MNDIIKRCADIISNSDSLLIGAGAGMGVDSGLPDFRGDKGFWQAYPALAESNVKFYEIANPRYFEKNPDIAWGFYGHRLKLYRETIPHRGFEILKNIGENLPKGYFVFTSNVDGQFQKAGFDADLICEIHGSIHYLQCNSHGIWDANNFLPDIDEATCKLISSFPRCGCGRMARPNIMMFSDFRWNDSRTNIQENKLKEWLKTVNNTVIIEIGAGQSIPTVRELRNIYNISATLIRVNPREFQVNENDIGLSMGALEFLSELEKEYVKRK